MKLNFTTNRKAEFNGKEFELTGQFEYLGGTAFHLMMNNEYKYFTIEDMTINAIDIKSVDEFIKYFLS